MQAWHEDADFWHALAPIIFSPANWGNAPLEVTQGLALLKPARQAAVLDLACGPGRHALEFARRGFRVTAVDIMPAFLAQIRRQARQERFRVELVHADMRAFVRPQAFDVVWNYFTSFGYFDDPADDQKVVANIHASLGKKGRLLMEMSSRDHALKFWSEKVRFEHPCMNGITLIEEGRLSEDRSQIFLKWLLKKADRTATHHLVLRLYSAQALSSMLKSAGFKSIDLFGDISGTPYTPRSKRMVVVASK